MYHQSDMQTKGVCTVEAPTEMCVPTICSFRERDGFLASLWFRVAFSVAHEPTLAFYHRKSQFFLRYKPNRDVASS